MENLELVDLKGFFQVERLDRPSWVLRNCSELLNLN